MSEKLGEEAAIVHFLYLFWQSDVPTFRLYQSILQDNRFILLRVLYMKQARVQFPFEPDTWLTFILSLKWRRAEWDGHFCMFFVTLGVCA